MKETSSNLLRSGRIVGAQLRRPPLDSPSGLAAAAPRNKDVALKRIILSIRTRQRRLTMAPPPTSWPQFYALLCRGDCARSATAAAAAYPNGRIVLARFACRQAARRRRRRNFTAPPPATCPART